MKKLLITRIVVQTSETPYNEDYYPDMSIEQAVALEKDEEENDWMESFFESDDITIHTSVKVVNTDD